jgi:hypothetical protein
MLNVLHKEEQMEKFLTKKDLAEKICTSPQNLSNKLKRDNFSEKELLIIAEALECDFESAFVLRDPKERI